MEQFIGYQKTARGLIHYITLAPEHDRDLKLTRWCSEHGIVVSLGHTNGTYEDALKARQAGARSMTHVYNAMSGFSHRQPGMVGAALRLRDMYGELICDGIHSSPEALNIMFQAKNPGRIVMITAETKTKSRKRFPAFFYTKSLFVESAECPVHINKQSFQGFSSFI